jgi:NAD(P)-dependent dehydrogenase (short-subunit alcohol dehydrogenase family)
VSWAANRPGGRVLYVNRDGFAKFGPREAASITKENGPMDISGKRVVVLGGTSGIGLGVAQAAARAGASVVVASSRRASVDGALASLPADAEGHVVDLTDDAAVATLFERLGALDHLVYTAGETLRLGPLAAMDVASARDVLDVRYWGALVAAKHAAPRIRAGGSIVFTSGTAGRRPHAGWALGASVCAAMEGLTRALAVELAPLRVNIVAPGFVKSPLWSGMDAAEREALYATQADHLPLKHVGEPHEIAESYLYLMRQTYGTGQVIVVDGGGALA